MKKILLALLAAVLVMVPATSAYATNIPAICDFAVWNIPGNGTGLSVPTIARIDTASVDVITVRGTDNKIYVQPYYLGSGFPGYWLPIPNGLTTGMPKVKTTSASQVVVWVIGTDGDAWYSTSSNGTSWSVWVHTVGTWQYDQAPSNFQTSTPGHVFQVLKNGVSNNLYYRCN